MDRSVLVAFCATATLFASSSMARAQVADERVGSVTGALVEEGPRGGTHEHVPGTQIEIRLRAGEVLTVGTCGVTGAVASQDTTLGLLDPAGIRVAANDDACGGLGSRIVHRARTDGFYSVVLGCYFDVSCGGRVAWSIGDEEEPIPLAVVTAATQARALLGPDGQGALVDAWIQARFEEAGGFVLRLSGAPMGIGFGNRGGILGGGVQVLVGWDLTFLELSVGGGVATLSERPAGVTQRETATFALRVRFGLDNDLHLVVNTYVAIFGSEDVLAGIDGQVVIPIGIVEIIARGVYGFSGVWLGEVGVTIWPGGESRRGIGIAILAGGGALVYQPVCRFGIVCDAVVYAGPHVGLGIHVRP